jgi:hypothetical protein
MKQCNSCLEWKEEEDFNWRYKSLGIRHPTCKECQKFFRRQWYEGSSKERHLANVKERKHRVREEAREYVWNYLSTHPCEQCGENNPVVLEFHHTGDKEKEVSVMVASGYPIHTIQAEIDRCQVLCANCHRKITHTERGWYRGKK